MYTCSNRPHNALKPSCQKPYASAEACVHTALCISALNPHVHILRANMHILRANMHILRANMHILRANTKYWPMQDRKSLLNSAAA